MKKFPYFLMVVCLAGGLAACGGGSSSGEPGDTTDRDTSDDGGASAGAGAGDPVIVNTEPLEGLWMISSDFESSETLSTGEVLLDKGQILRVFQVASTGVQGEIEIIECSRDYWDSGEVISFADAENIYDGSTGGFLLKEARLLFFADDDAQLEATIVSNTEITFSPYDLDLPLEDGVQIISGTANNTVASKVHDSAETDLGSISYDAEDFNILCARIITSETRTDLGDLVSQDLGFIVDGAKYVDGKLNKKTRLLIAESKDDAGQLSTSAFIGENYLELEKFTGVDVKLLLNDDLSFSGSLGSSATFEGDIKHFEVE